MKTACLTGITGQTASYIAELLLQKNHKVYGLVRRSSNFNTQRIDHLFDNPNLELVYGDLSDSSSISDFISKYKPDYFFNMAAQSHVRVSFDIPEYTMDVTGSGVLRCLEAIRKYSPNTRFIQASSSEMFGASPPPQNEDTPFHPRSPYAVAKISGYWSTINYREAYDMYCSNLIMFNTESQRRGETFVTRKITRAATRIKMGLQSDLYLGNIEAKRDWSHAKDVARAAYMAITAPVPKDYVVASGISHSVRDFAALVFDELGLNYKDYVKFDSKYLRPTEVDYLLGNASKIKAELGWVPEYSFGDLVREMIDADMELAKQEKLIKDSIK